MGLTPAAAVAKDGDKRRLFIPGPIPPPGGKELN